MKRVVIFTEGLTELAFVRQFLIDLLGYQDLSFECLQLHGGEFQTIPYEHFSPTAYVYALIVDAHGDGRVLGIISEREKELSKAGYDRICGLRDMYSLEYRRRSRIIDPALNREFEMERDEQIQLLENANKIRLYFAIMEIEAWLLSMYNLFGKIDSALTVEAIEDALGFNLRTVDPQVEFFHPTRQMDDIFRIIGKSYRKHSHEIESIVSTIESSDLANAIENGRCRSFAAFATDLEDFIFS